MSAIPERPIFTLRPAANADKAWLFDLHEHLFRSHIEQIWRWDIFQQVAIFEREWEETRFRVIEVNGEPAGWVQQTDAPGCVTILSLALSAQFQSLGIGGEVIARLKSEAQNRGLPVRLNVFRTNPRAMKFYQRHGFVEIKTGENGTRMEWRGENTTSAGR